MPYITGLPVEDMQIESVIGDGAYATVYSAVETRTGTRRAVKVAKKEPSDGGGTGAFQSVALEYLTSGFGEFQPNNSELLAKQFEMLSTVSNKHSVHVYERKSVAGLDMLVLEFVEGTTLRELIKSGQATIQHWLQLARALANLREDEHFTKHGDIKPENVIIKSDGTAVLIDPGYYGEITRNDGKLVAAAITTPQYYPHVNGDDQLALGLILWEICTGNNLLASNSSATKSAAGALEERILMTERTGNRFLGPLRSAVAPDSINQQLNPELAHVVAKAVQLRFVDSHTPDFDYGFGSVSEIIAAVQAAI